MPTFYGESVDICWGFILSFGEILFHNLMIPFPLQFPDTLKNSRILSLISCNSQLRNIHLSLCVVLFKHLFKDKSKLCMKFLYVVQLLRKRQSSLNVRNFFK